MQSNQKDTPGTAAGPTTPQPGVDDGTMAGSIPDAEQALTLLEVVLSERSDGFALLDRSLRFVRVSERLAQINGVSAQAHLGRTAEHVLGPDAWIARRDALEAALAGQAALDIALPGPGLEIPGSPRHVRASYFPVRSGQMVVGVAVVVRDVTERVESEARLRQQSAAFENMWDALIITDLAGRITDCNGAFVRLSGFSRKETLGQPISFLHLPEEREWVMPQIAEGMLRNGRWEGEVRFVRKDGTQGVSLTSVVPLRDEEGNVIGTVGANRDITEAKRVEEEMRHTQAENLRLLERDRNAAERQRVFLKDVLRSVSEGKLRLVDDASELPTPLPQAGRPIRLDTTQKLRVFRQRARRAAERLGFPDLRWQHLVTATSEAAMNAIVHAGGGVGRICAGGSTAQVWVEDRGKGIAYDILPRATLEKGWSSGASLGHGFWLMLNTVDRVWLLTSDTGTVVVIEQQRDEPLPTFFGDLPA